MTHSDLTMAAAELSGQLLSEGYLIIERAAVPELLAVARHDLAPHFSAAAFGQGPFYGGTTKRFGRLLSRLSNPKAFVMHDLVFAIVKAALGPDNGIQLNLSQAIEIHPGAPVQVPHRDHDMWCFAKAPGTTYMVNVMWTLDAFTKENGATRIWPRTNHADYDVMIPHEPDAVAAVAPAGSAILFLGQTLHSGGANRSARPRQGMIFSYCLDWLLPDENPWLAYPPDIARSFPGELAALAGYRQRFAGLNNFEGCDPARLLDPSMPAYLPFTDDMSPDQKALILGYYEMLENSQAA